MKLFIFFDLVYDLVWFIIIPLETIVFIFWFGTGTPNTNWIGRFDTKLTTLLVTQLTLLMFSTEIYRVQILPPLTNKLYISPLNPLMLILNPTENLTNMHFRTLTSSVKAIVVWCLTIKMKSLQSILSFLLLVRKDEWPVNST